MQRADLSGPVERARRFCFAAAEDLLRTKAGWRHTQRRVDQLASVGLFKHHLKVGRAAVHRHHGGEVGQRHVAIWRDGEFAAEFAAEFRRRADVNAECGAGIETIGGIPG